MTTIRYNNNHGLGYADKLEVETGSTIGELFSRTMPNENSGNFTIKINEEKPARTQVLQENDLVVITPGKVAGA